MLEIARVGPTDADANALIQAHIERSRRYYPIASCHSYDAGALAEMGVVLYLGRAAGEAVCVGGYRPLDANCAEMKSVFTKKSARGNGYGLTLIRHLMSEARAAGYGTFCLETGSDDASAAARSVYEKLGFAYRGPFGSYSDDPLSAYMQVSL